MARSKIEWTESTWNPVTGCTKVSLGCKNCYAERMARRLKAIGHPHYQNGFEVTLHEESVEQPLKWRKPQMIFVNSMSDMFHEKVPEEFIKRVFTVMRQAWWHTFQILTKRAERMSNLANAIDWPPNVWVGVTIEGRRYCHRLEFLRNVSSYVRFVSFEPLIEPVGEIDLSGIDWVIVGGESGPKARPMAKPWVLEIRDQCASLGIPFFFKQWGGQNKKKNGRMLEGRTWDELPREPMMFQKSTPLSRPQWSYA